MDFEQIDVTQWDCLGPGDIVQVEGDFWQILSLDEDRPDGIVVFNSHNLSTGDEDIVLNDFDSTTTIYRSY